MSISIRVAKIIVFSALKSLTGSGSGDCVCNRSAFRRPLRGSCAGLGGGPDRAGSERRTYAVTANRITISAVSLGSKPTFAADRW